MALIASMSGCGSAVAGETPLVAPVPTAVRGDARVDQLAQSDRDQLCFDLIAFQNRYFPPPFVTEFACRYIAVSSSRDLQTCAQQDAFCPYRAQSMPPLYDACVFDPTTPCDVSVDDLTTCFAEQIERTRRGYELYDCTRGQYGPIAAEQIRLSLPTTQRCTQVGARCRVRVDHAP